MFTPRASACEFASLSLMELERTFKEEREVVSLRALGSEFAPSSLMAFENYKKERCLL